MEFASMNAIVRLLAVYTGLSLLLCAFTRMEWSPLQPNGFGQWVALFLLIFPAAAAAEFLGERLFGRPPAIEVAEKRTHSDCSWGRVATGVLVLVVTFGVVLGAAWWLSHPAASI
jgi:CDP-diglyceride synthetase